MTRKIARLLCAALLMPACQAERPETDSLSKQLTLTAIEKISDAQASQLLTAALEPGERIDDLFVRTLPYTNATIIEASVNSGTHARRVTLDGNGLAINKLAAMDAERAKQFAVSGKLSRDLHSHIAGLNEAARVRVAIRHPTNVTPIELPQRAGSRLRRGGRHGDGAGTGGGLGGGGADRANELNAWILEGRAQHSTQLTNERRTLVEWLRAHGAADISERPFSASVVANVTVEFLLDANLHNRDDVTWVDFANHPDPGELAGYAVHGAMDEEAFDPGSGGGGNYCSGSCIYYPLVGIWELGFGQQPARIANYNSRFNTSTNASYYQPATTCSTDTDCYSGLRQTVCESGVCVAGHTSNVAASVGMKGSYAQEGGLFPHAGTYQTQFRIANDGDNIALDWLLTEGVIHANRSQGMSGSATTESVYEVDFAARNSFFFMTQSSGNGGTSSSDQHTCPAYNTLCVGAYFYSSYAVQTDDLREPTSSYQNQNGSGLERPHVLGPDRNAGTYLPDVEVSPGSNAMTRFSTVGSGTVNRGTSFASPAVLSIANQMHVYEGYFSHLAYPIVKKAILMAGAIDANQDGAILKGNSWTNTPDGEDGAGGPNVRHIKRILDANTYSFKSLTAASFTSCGSNCLQTYVGTVSVPSTHAVRATLAFNSCTQNTQAGIYENSPANDFDLWLVSSNPFFPFSLSSTSVGNEVDALHYHDGFSSRTYNIYVRLKSGATLDLCGSESSEPVAVAWDTYPIGGLGQ